MLILFLNFIHILSFSIYFIEKQCSIFYATLNISLLTLTTKNANNIILFLIGEIK